MSRILPAFASLMLAVLIVSPAAQSQPAGERLLTAAQVVQARQASLEMSVMTMAYLKNASENGVELKKLGFAANALALWAKTLPILFPAGTAMGQTPIDSKAKPEIWTNRAQFESRAADYAAATTKLFDLSQAGDSAGFAAQLGVVKKACDGCHSDFQAR
jgi:cytochrome c556